MECVAVIHLAALSSAKYSRSKRGYHKLVRPVMFNQAGYQAVCVVKIIAGVWVLFLSAVYVFTYIYI